MTRSYPHLAVLLAAHNGMRWLPEQLRSILAQTGVTVTVFISVDASTDGTEEWVDEMAALQPRVVALPHGFVFGGAAPNFFRLLRDVDVSGFDFVSLADQDDVWLDTKLERAIAMMRDRSVAAYSSNVTAFWPSGRQQLIVKSQPQRRWDFLFEAAGPGCTYVLSLPLAQDIQRLLLAKPGLVTKIGLHDWFIYALARAHGHKWVIDEQPGIMYRQHQSNQVGVNRGLRALVQRARKVFSGWAFGQAELIANLIGLGQDPFVRNLSCGTRLGYVRLMLSASHCRRRPVDRIVFAASCLFMAIKPVSRI